MHFITLAAPVKMQLTVSGLHLICSFDSKQTPGAPAAGASRHHRSCRCRLRPCSCGSNSGSGSHETSCEVRGRPSAVSPAARRQRLCHWCKWRSPIPRMQSEGFEPALRRSRCFVAPTCQCNLAIKMTLLTAAIQESNMERPLGWANKREGGEGCACASAVLPVEEKTWRHGHSPSPRPQCGNPRSGTSAQQPDHLALGACSCRRGKMLPCLHSVVQNQAEVRLGLQRSSCADVPSIALNRCLPEASMLCPASGSDADVWVTHRVLFRLQY